MDISLSSFLVFLQLLLIQLPGVNQDLLIGSHSNFLTPEQSFWRQMEMDSKTNSGIY
jgi:hypothetical protein